MAIATPIQTTRRNHARWIGIGLTTIGILAMAGLLGPVGNYTYAITWWGILILFDEWNHRHRKLSLWRGQPNRFAFVTLPLSVIFWLFFEMLNLGSPQWRYVGGLPNVASQVLFGFVSFGTVIPIVIELYWLIAGRFALPSRPAEAMRRHSFAIAVAGIVLTLIPFLNHRFWLNQGMWLAPAFLFLPAGRIPEGIERTSRLVLKIAAAGIASGLLWEALNWFSRTHWEYLILRSWPHLFQMPWIGYIGFVPFAFTVLLIYAFAERIPPDHRAGLCLYGIALAGLYGLTLVYNHRGLWLGPG